MRIVQDQLLQHFDRCLLKLGNGDLPIAELTNSIHISPEKQCKIQDDSDIAISESHRHLCGEDIFWHQCKLPCPGATVDLWIAERALLTPKNNSVYQINGVIKHEVLHEEATFYPVLTVQVILEIPPYFPWNS